MAKQLTVEKMKEVCEERTKEIQKLEGDWRQQIEVLHSIVREVY